MSRLAVLACLMLAVLPARNSAQQISARFYPEKSEYLVGEPIFVIFEVVNEGSEVVQVANDNCGWISVRFAAPNATPLREPSLFGCLGGGIGGSCGSGGLSLGPEEQFRRRFLVDGPFRFDSPGLHTLIGRRPQRIYADTEPYGGLFSEDVATEMVVSLAPGGEEELAAAYAPIVRDLDHPDAAVRALALAAVIQNPPRFLEPLILRLSETEQLAPAAITGLKRLGTTRAKEKLAALARNQLQEGLRQQAIGALGVLGDEAYCSTALEVVEASEEYSRWIALRAAGHLCGEKALPTIMRFLTSADRVARAEAAFAVGNTRSALAILPLIGILGDPDEHVRYVATQALFTLTHRRLKFSTSEPADGARAQQDWIDWWTLNSPTAKIYGIEDCPN